MGLGVILMSFALPGGNLWLVWAWGDEFPLILPHFLRDGIASGRGVHRFWGVPIQKSRSLFGHFSRFSPIFWIFGVGVLYWATFPGRCLNWASSRKNWLSRSGYFTLEILGIWLVIFGKIISGLWNRRLWATLFGRVVIYLRGFGCVVFLARWEGLI